MTKNYSAVTFSDSIGESKNCLEGFKGVDEKTSVKIGNLEVKAREDLVKANILHNTASDLDGFESELTDLGIYDSLSDSIKEKVNASKEESKKNVDRLNNEYQKAEHELKEYYNDEFVIHRDILLDSMEATWKTYQNLVLYKSVMEYFKKSVLSMEEDGQLHDLPQGVMDMVLELRSKKPEQDIKKLGSTFREHMRKFHHPTKSKASGTDPWFQNQVEARRSALDPDGTDTDLESVGGISGMSDVSDSEIRNPKVTGNKKIRKTKADVRKRDSTLDDGPEDTMSDTSIVSYKGNKGDFTGEVMLAIAVAGLHDLYNNLYVNGKKEYPLGQNTSKHLLTAKYKNAAEQKKLRPEFSDGDEVPKGPDTLYAKVEIFRGLVQGKIDAMLDEDEEDSGDMLGAIDYIESLLDAVDLKNTTDPIEKPPEWFFVEVGKATKGKSTCTSLTYKQVVKDTIPPWVKEKATEALQKSSPSKVKGSTKSNPSVTDPDADATDADVSDVESVRSHRKFGFSFKKKSGGSSDTETADSKSDSGQVTVTNKDTMMALFTCFSNIWDQRLLGRDKSLFGQDTPKIFTSTKKYADRATTKKELKESKVAAKLEVLLKAHAVEVSPFGDMFDEGGRLQPIDGEMPQERVAKLLGEWQELNGSVLAVEPLSFDAS